MLELEPQDRRDGPRAVAIIDRLAEPISYQNDFIGVLHEANELDDGGRRSHVRPKLKAELRSFARTWFRNLRAQGFLECGVRRRILA